MTDAARIRRPANNWESDIHSLFLVSCGARLVHGVAPRVLQDHAPRVQVVSRELKYIFMGNVKIGGSEKYHM